MPSFLLTAAAAAASLSTSAVALVPTTAYTFDQFIVDFRRDYSVGSHEYARRRAVFEARLRSILAHNEDPGATWTRGVNEFADMDSAEFRSTRLGLHRPAARVQAALGARHRGLLEPVSVEDLPSSVDWRAKGVVSPVKDQGHCGSCWAFATTEVVESHVAIATGTMLTLSPEQLVECAPNPLKCGGIGGCEGSIPEVAFNYIQLHGMTTEWMMPYNSYFGGKASGCSLNTTKAPAVIEISGYQRLPANDYAAVMQALATIGPLAVNVQAEGWSDYEGGIYAGCSNLSAVTIDHVVQLVGYGTTDESGYWLVRNSWDATWGENGYIRLHRTSSPECGTDTQPLDGTGCEGGPPTQHVCGHCGMLFDVSFPLGAKVVKYGHHDSIVV